MTPDVPESFKHELTMHDHPIQQPLDAVVAGHLCLDLTPDFAAHERRALDELLRPGRLVNIGGVTIATGGAVSNTGLNLVRLGVRTRLLAKIGDDPLGGLAQDCLRRHGHGGEGLVVVPGEQTSYTVVLAPPGVDRIFLHNPGANDTFGAADVSADGLRGASLFHLGYPPLMRRLYLNAGAEVIEIFRHVKAQGLTTSLDMSLPDPESESGRAPWRTILERLLPLVDLAQLSAEEAMFMMDRPRFERLRAQASGAEPMAVYGLEEITWLGEEMLRLGAGLAVVKCGAQGLYLRTASGGRLAALGGATPAGEWAARELFEEIYSVPRVVSATGAGDAAIAGFLAAFLRGLPPEQCLKTACSVGAQCVQAHDALSGVGGWSETCSLIRDWPKTPSSWRFGPGWRYDAGARVWRGAHDKVAEASPILNS